MRRLLFSLLVVLFAAVASPASAAIVVQKGIAGVSLGDRESRVRAVLGEPARIRKDRNEIGSFRVFVYKGGVRVNFFAGSRVTNISTTGQAQRTSTGVGVGTSERALRANVGGETCRGSGATRMCVIGRELPGGRVTYFRIRDGAVREVGVGFVID